MLRLLALVGYWAVLSGLPKVGWAFASQRSSQPRDSSEVVNTLTKYLSIPSVSGEEKPAALFFRDFCLSKGLYVEMLDEGDSSINFIASIKPLALRLPNYVFLHHVDVVPPGEDAEWKYPPFSASIHNGKIYARGATDNKGQGILQLYALLAFRDTAKVDKLPFNYSLLVVSGEETGGKNGAMKIANQFIERINPVAVFGEGGGGVKGIIPGHPAKTVFSISVAEKTNLWLKVDYRLKSAGHGSSQPKYTANKVMIKALDRLNDLEGRMRFSKTTIRMFERFGSAIGGVKGFVVSRINWLFFRPLARRVFRTEPYLGAAMRNTTILTRVENPKGAINQIPDKMTAYLDCRLLPGTSTKQFLKDISHGIFEKRFDFTILDIGPMAGESSVENPVYWALEQAIKEEYGLLVPVIPVLFPASTDNNYFRSKGIPTYGLTPIVYEREQTDAVHSVNEYISLKNVEEGISTYHRIMHLIAKLPVARVVDEVQTISQESTSPK